MEVKKTGATALKFIKPKAIIVEMYTGASGEVDDNPSGSKYILDNVIKDTTSISQDDNDTQTVECETSDASIIDIVTLGKRNFASEVGDVQDDLLVDLCDFTVVGTGDNKKVIAPSSYEIKYAKVSIVLGKKGGYTALVLPKMQLNSKVMAESLNSNMARIGLAGTAKDAELAVDGKKFATPFYIKSNYVMPDEESSEYSASKTYNYGAVVSVGGKTYACIADGTTGAAPASSPKAWKELVTE